MRHLVVDSEASAGQAAGDTLLLHAPALAEFPRRTAFAMIQLPVVALNDITLRSLAAGPRPPPSTYCAVYAADPFADWARLAASLRSRGYEGVANFPSLALLESSERDRLAEAGFSFESEIERLQWFAERGLSSLCVVAERPDSERALRGLGTALTALLVMRAQDRLAPASDDAPFARFEPLRGERIEGSEVPVFGTAPPTGAKAAR